MMGKVESIVIELSGIESPYIDNFVGIPCALFVHLCLPSNLSKFSALNRSRQL